MMTEVVFRNVECVFDVYLIYSIRYRYDVSLASSIIPRGIHGTEYEGMNDVIEPTSYSNRK